MSSEIDLQIFFKSTCKSKKSVYLCGPQTSETNLKKGNKIFFYKKFANIK